MTSTNPSIDYHFHFSGMIGGVNANHKCGRCFEVFGSVFVCYYNMDSEKESISSFYGNNKQSHEMDRLFCDNNDTHKHCDYYYGHGGANNINAKEGFQTVCHIYGQLWVLSSVLNSKLNGDLAGSVAERKEIT